MYKPEKLENIGEKKEVQVGNPKSNKQVKKPMRPTTSPSFEEFIDKNFG
ncbi:MAG: hypothetical protein QW478_01320 [Candidatus Micrarchaeaceae archaeon]